MIKKYLVPWRGEAVTAIAVGDTWFLSRVAELTTHYHMLRGPSVIPGEEWPEFAPRLLAWLDGEFPVGFETPWAPGGGRNERYGPSFATEPGLKVTRVKETDGWLAESPRASRHRQVRHAAAA